MYKKQSQEPENGTTGKVTEPEGEAGQRISQRKEQLESDPFAGAALRE